MVIAVAHPPIHLPDRTNDERCIRSDRLDAWQNFDEFRKFMSASNHLRPMSRAEGSTLVESTSPESPTDDFEFY